MVLSSPIFDNLIRFLLFSTLQGFYHIDLFILPGHHQADQKRHAEGQQDRNAVGQHAEHELHLIFSRKRRDQPLEYTDARGKSDDDADKGHPDVLSRSRHRE